MCGIFGYFGKSQPIDQHIREWAGCAKTKLRHRGPDGSRILEVADSNCLLGHTRLSIIDIEGGNQPIANEDETVWVVLNGEIYNYVELREELRPRHQFRTASDTEVLVHLYEEKGAELVHDLVGMFAFAIFDKKNRKLLLARDRFGEKPLYYTQTPTGFGFASELKALADLPGVERRSDGQALAQYLALGYIPAPRTIYEGIKKVRASETLEIGLNGEPRSNRYWAISFREQKQTRDSDLLEQFDALFSDSIKLRLRSDVPIGAFLSGGIDSSLVACYVRKLLPEAELQTFCAGFDDALLDERPYARTMSAALATNHEEVRIDEDELLKAIWEVTLHFDEPYADYSSLPTYCVSAAASKKLKVMLSGDGADELFGGYSSYYSYRSWNGMRRVSLINRLASPLARIWPKGKSGKGLLGFLGKDDYGLLREKAFNEAFVFSVVRPELHEVASNGIAELEGLLNPHSGRGYPYSLMELQAGELTLPEQLMTKIDRASMKVGLECRAPFLDHRLAEFAAGIPAEANFDGKFGKLLLRKALPEFVPDQIRWRQKRGFTPPLASWLRKSLKPAIAESIDRAPTALREFCDADAVRPLFTIHSEGKDDVQDLLFRWMVAAKHFENQPQ